MKTAVSIPEEIFSRAEILAKRLGVSRSRLYAEAIRQFIESQRSTGVTSTLNSIYGESESSVDPALEEIQRLTVEKAAW